MNKILVIILTLLTLFTAGCGAQTAAPLEKGDEALAPEEITHVSAPEEAEAVSAAEADTETSALEQDTVASAPEEAAEASVPEVDTEVSAFEQTEEALPPQSVQQEATPVASNSFFNDMNFAYDIDNVTIKPRHVYYENGHLVAECFVINGFSHPVWNIVVKSLEFQDGSGNNITTDAYFGGLGGLTLGAYQYAVWTFTFESDAILSPNADLNYLYCYSITEYAY